MVYVKLRWSGRVQLHLSRLRGSFRREWEWGGTPVDGSCELKRNGVVESDDSHELAVLGGILKRRGQMPWRAWIGIGLEGSIWKDKALRTLDACNRRRRGGTYGIELIWLAVDELLFRGWSELLNCWGTSAGNACGMQNGTVRSACGFHLRNWEVNDFFVVRTSTNG